MNQRPVPRAKPLAPAVPPIPQSAALVPSPQIVDATPFAAQSVATADAVVLSHAQHAREIAAGICPWCKGATQRKASAFGLSLFIGGMLGQVVGFWAISLIAFAILCVLAIALGKKSPIGLGVTKVRDMVSYDVCTHCGKQVRP